MKRKEFSKEKAIFVLLCTIIIFSIGVYIGNYNSVKKIDQVKTLSETFQMNTLAMEVEYEILKENICENDEVLFLTDSLFQLSEKVSYMENLLGADDYRVVELKDYYFILEAKHWLLAKKRAETCFIDNNGLNTSTILYFYSDKDSCPKCSQQATVLDYLHQKHEGLKVYSFDVKSKSPVVDVLKKLFMVTNQTPTLVVNGELYSRFIDLDEFNLIEEKSTINDTINKSVGNESLLSGTNDIVRINSTFWNVA